MLIQSKNKNEKIILGLLSYTLEEGQHQTDLLQSSLETNRQSDSKEIYIESKTKIISLAWWGLKPFNRLATSQNIQSQSLLTVLPSYHHSAMSL